MCPCSSPASWDTGPNGPLEDRRSCPAGASGGSSASIDASAWSVWRCRRSRCRRSSGATAAGEWTNGPNDAAAQEHARPSPGLVRPCARRPPCSRASLCHLRPGGAGNTRTSSLAGGDLGRPATSRSDKGTSGACRGSWRERSADTFMVAGQRGSFVPNGMRRTGRPHSGRYAVCVASSCQWRRTASGFNSGVNRVAASAVGVFLANHWASPRECDKRPSSRMISFRRISPAADGALSSWHGRIARDSRDGNDRTRLLQRVQALGRASCGPSSSRIHVCACEER